MAEVREDLDSVMSPEGRSTAHEGRARVKAEGVAKTLSAPYTRRFSVKTRKIAGVNASSHTRRACQAVRLSRAITLASRTAEVKPDELLVIFDPIQVVQESLIDVGPCVSQRILEAHGGHLDVKQGRAEVSFTATLPATQP